ncbi:hypothetical protein TSUD_381850 [Trifolium subterraneum]|uniref:Uncharacterized protein n=1 Tax=Trifolium subterraneum TaxID=3900 RepID=A0A2Z6MD50_TRISU|nr:hypothetical protein TSUD_381850 [Trifolium subterraneum]
MAENIFEDATEVVKENCEVIQGEKINTMKKYLRISLALIIMLKCHKKTVSCDVPVQIVGQTNVTDH